MVAEVGYELPDDVRDRWWNDGIDGTEHDEHSQSRDHYVAWQQARMRGMLDECGVPAPNAGRADRARRARSARHRHIAAYDEALGRARRAAEPRAHARDLLQLGLGSRTRRSTAAGLTGTVDVIVSSAWVGARKPHRAHVRRGARPRSASRRRTRCSSATRGRATSKARARPGCAAVYVRRPHFGADTTAPDDHHTQDVHRADDLRGRARPRSTDAASVHRALVPGPVRRAQVPLQHLHRARQRQRLGAELHRLRHLVARRSTRGRAR